MKRFAVVALVSFAFQGNAFSQEVGSAAAYRFNQQNQLRLSEELAEWNAARKISVSDDKKLETKPNRDTPFENLADKSIIHMDHVVCQVVSIVDRSNLIIKVGIHLFWITELSTEGIADSEKLVFLDAFKVDGTKSYNSAIKTNTVKRLRPLSKTEQTNYDKQQEEIKRIAFERKANSFKLKNGEVVVAIFVSFENRVLTVIDDKGIQKQYDSGDLSADAFGVIRKIQKQEATAKTKKP